MKLKFKRQQFQDDAVKSVVDLFKGNNIAPSTFAVEKMDIVDLAGDDLLGYANNLNISMEQIQQNLKEVQDRNLLPLTELKKLQFNIEMETGTGKTFVYTKTILELHKQYGFKKFIVVVPSVAIREGVFSSMRATKDYFKQEYDGITLKPFIYSSANRDEVRNYALSSNLEIMIVNIDAFKKDENLFNKPTDRMPKSPKEYIQECRPVIIIDEPQSVDNTPLSRKAIEDLNGLFEIRYSATHRQKINTVYKLTPVDAYNMHIVKQICVVNNNIADDFNKPYIKLLSVDSTPKIRARLEVDGIVGGKAKHTQITVEPGDHLTTKTRREIYEDYVVAGINAMEGFEEIEFTNTETLKIGQSIGDIDDDIKKRELIKQTIENHLNKEKMYIQKGIKVLSLFFIDEVAKYRNYTNPEDTRGVYAKMFEECYDELINLPKYADVKEYFNTETSKVHDGYFSQDKKSKKFKDTKEGRETQDDYDTYALIMKDKEKLLSFTCPIRFIFSHSALKEGWDNPNVFQICTLLQNKTAITCRQKIGRGLRLCVDQNGERVEDKNINILHIIAEENFAEFADKLQKEIEDETGVKFGVIDLNLFVDIPYIDEQGTETKTSVTDARQILEHFRSKNYVDTKGKIKDTLKNDLLNGTVDLPKKFEKIQDRIVKQIESVNKTVKIVPSNQQVTVKLKDIAEDETFIKLWNRIKQKTIYKINMSKEKLIEKCVAAINDMDAIGKTKMFTETAKIIMDESGVDYKSGGQKFEEIENEILLPDIVGILAKSCKLTRDTVTQIVLQSDRLEDFARNPQRYIEQVTDIINHIRADECIDGISYTKAEGEEYSLFEVFDIESEKEFTAFLDRTAVAVNHSIYDYVVYDNSETERDFALALDNDSEVKLFFKIPDNFKISTPIGDYNPDWALYAETEHGEKKLYFVVETKGSLNFMQLRDSESIKIRCGKKHFEALGEDVGFRVSTKDFNDFKRRCF